MNRKMQNTRGGWRGERVSTTGSTRCDYCLLVVYAAHVRWSTTIYLRVHASSTAAVASRAKTLTGIYLQVGWTGSPSVWGVCAGEVEHAHR